MPPLSLRQEFPTLRHFKEALHVWAIEAHFEPRILKSDTGRVRVGCKRDPKCPFVVRCNWERKNGRDPLARITVLKERHTCLDGMEWRGVPVNAALRQERTLVAASTHDSVLSPSPPPSLLGQHQQQQEIQQLEIHTDPSTGFIIGGARIVGSLPPRQPRISPVDPSTVPIAPKVHRNSASRLQFLIEIIPRLMEISLETAPAEIRECLMREYGQEVNVQQCRRAKIEILKRQASKKGGMNESTRPMIESDCDEKENPESTSDKTGSTNTGTFTSYLSSVPSVPFTTAPDSHAQAKNGAGGIELDVNLQVNSSEKLNRSSNPISIRSPAEATTDDVSPPRQFPLHATSNVAILPSTPIPPAVSMVASEPPVRCPYCVNHRYMRTVREAVEHMSMHVVV
ncbi:BgTH12-00170 [Blumeria graminis f. sp. triticale]|uniref:Bgt-5112 n=3 Tax=Blumeria graminis TaxID=34373 RepID=A0A9X9MLE0_BLUGR|nr:hypothetical protein BGT96224_5112 [Blumeria graminis f. sp. tritici 96224]CAD6504664.1 BgTH12-00170 [Blumeria graminis f. sp. triticale]VDB92702.1 Bgt-5112 [Blumeria graminis f. sp. tritici]